MTAEIQELIAMYLQPNSDIRATEMNEICTKIATEIDSKLVGTTFIGSIIPSATPTGTGTAFWIATQAGTYTNFGGVVVAANSFAVISRDGAGAFSISQTALNLSEYQKIVDGNKINTWTAKAYLSGDQVNYLGKDWVSNAATLLNDIPGTSGKWVERLSFYTKNEFNEITGDKTLTNYPVDFTPFTSIGGSNKIWINDIPVTKRGRLSSLRIKTVSAGTITIYVYSISGTNGSYVYTKLKEFLPVVTTTAEQSINLTDTYVVEAGQFIGFKSSVNVFFIGSGFKSYDINSPSSVVFKFAYDFIINENLVLGIKDRVTTLENGVGTFPARMTNIENSIGASILKSYNVDFTPLTSNGGGSNIYANKTSLVTTRSVLKSVRVKAPVGATVTIYAIQVTGVSDGSYSVTTVHTFPTFTATSLITTSYILDNYILEVGQYLGYKTSSGVYFGVTGSLASYQVGSSTSPALIVGIDFTLDENTISTGLLPRISLLETAKTTNDLDIVNLKANNIQNVALKPCVLFSSKFNSLTAFTNTNWVINASGTSPIALGTNSTNYLWLKNRYHIEELFLNLNMELYTDTIFTINTHDLGYKQGDGIFKINCVNSTLKIFNSDPSFVLTEVATVTIPFAIVDGRSYTITLQKQKGWISTFKLTDSITGTSISCNYGTSINSLGTQNRQQDSYMFYQESGATFVTLSEIGVFSKEKPLVYLCGDSITEGVYFSTSDYDSRYGVLLKNKLKGSVLISARGGSVLNDVIETVETEVAFIKPTYVMMTIGTNGGINVTNLTTLVNRIIALGSSVILNHVPNIGNGSHITINANIDTVIKNTGAIKGALFDVATSVSNNPANSYIVADYFDTGVHPNASGQLKMYNRFEIDLPFLFI